MRNDELHNMLSDENTANFLKKNVDTIRENILKMEEKFHRSFVSIYIIFGVFLCLMHATVTEVMVGPFRLQEFEIIYRLFPLTHLHTSIPMFSDG